MICYAGADSLSFNRDFSASSINQAAQSFSAWFGVSANNIATLESSAFNLRNNYFNHLKQCIPGSYKYPYPNINYVSNTTPIYFLQESIIYGYDNQNCIVSNALNVSQTVSVCGYSKNSISFMTSASNQEVFTLTKISESLKDLAHKMMSNPYTLNIFGAQSPLENIANKECKDVNKVNTILSKSSILQILHTLPNDPYNLQNQSNYKEFAANIHKITEPLESAIGYCFFLKRKVEGCDGGTNKIPNNQQNLTGPIESFSV